MKHGVTHGGEPFALSKALPVILADALIQPLKGNAEAMRKASKMVFNVWDPSLWASIRTDANEFYLGVQHALHQPSAPVLE